MGEAVVRHCAGFWPEMPQIAAVEGEEHRALPTFQFETRPGNGQQQARHAYRNAGIGQANLKGYDSKES